ncbi:hypothetical protein Pfo_011798 [Paulownia fortunei]|nr:hypothetical protein Pfo_011798 [Paulownia fortunei]
MAASSSQGRNISDAVALDSSVAEKLQKLLVDYGIELLKPCGSTEELLGKLDELENLLSHIIQDYKALVEVALQPSKEALIANELLRHAEMDVRVSVASCISEIIRITAPDEPYEEDQMKEFFQLAVSAFESLSCMSGRAYSKAVSILESISYSQSCVVMLDLQLHGIVHQMFHLFLNGIKTSHSHAIFSNMENIMTLIIRNNVDYDEFSLELARILLARLKKENQNVSPVAFQLAENTFKNCSDDLKTYLPEAVRCLGIPVEDYADVVASLIQDATQRENMDSKDIGVDASCHGEAGLPTDGGLSNLTVGNKTEILKTDEKFNENRWTTSHCCDEPENLGSPKQQQESKPEDVPIQKKRSRKPNSLIKPEEGYDPLCMLGIWTSMKDSHCRKDKRKTICNPRKKMISKDSCLSSRPAGEPSSAPISQKAKRIKKHSVERQGSSAKIPLEEKSRGKTIVSEDHRRDIIVKTLASRPISSKGEALSGKVSKPLHKRKSTKSKEEASKVRDESRCFGEELVGCKIQVWWPLDEMFYEGKITSFDQLNKKHKVDYDDGDHEILDLAKECWQLIGDDNMSPHEQKTVTSPSASTEMLNDV